ncbi:uncharacterized protein LOC144360976 [Saccoglossus kowalevskii]
MARNKKDENHCDQSDQRTTQSTNNDKQETREEQTPGEITRLREDEPAGDPNRDDTVTTVNTHSRIPDFTQNNEIRQLAMFLVAFSVAIVGIALLVLRDNVAMLVCGILFLSTAVLSFLIAAVWRCCDVKRFTTIGTEYTVAPPAISETEDAVPEQTDQISPV